MKKYLHGILVVEGKEDESYLSSFIETEFVLTNGYEIPQEELKFLKEAGKHTIIYVLTDPDQAGKEIENRLKKELGDTANYCSIDISQCNRGKKKGVAECDKEEILKVLNDYLTDKPMICGKLLYKEIYPLSKVQRNQLSQKFNLGICNNKKLISRLNILNISKEEVLKELGRL